MLVGLSTESNHTITSRRRRRRRRRRTATRSRRGKNLLILFLVTKEPLITMYYVSITVAMRRKIQKLDQEGSIL
jgi:hypothetical protein